MPVPQRERRLGWPVLVRRFQARLLEVVTRSFLPTDCLVRDMIEISLQAINF
jgi:hypothetical protein